MNYADYTFWGMHLVWWVIWGALIFWIYAIPYDVPGQRSKKNTPLEVLKKRFAAGQFSNEEYLEKKRLLES